MNGQTVAAQRSVDDNQRATILIVDDEPTNLEVLSHLLQAHYRVRAANSGASALRAAATEPRPDLILLDVMMPGMDGYAVLARLKESARKQDIPIIFVTAMDSIEDETRGLEAGAADYIKKPISPALVLARVRSQLEARQARDMLTKINQQLLHKVEQGSHALEQAQLQFVQMEKMASLGQIAAGVAHEINNPVGFVGSNFGVLAGYAQDIIALIAAYEEAERKADNAPLFAQVQSLRKSLDFEYIKKDVGELLRESEDGLKRIRVIVQDLKNFAHADEMIWEWTDLHQCIDSTLNMVWSQLKYHCTVRKNYAQLPKIHCLPSQINQVVMNLLVNADQAIKHKGEIVITTECAGDSLVRMRISDSGAGIPPTVLNRIFDPFFTTKPVGVGTGLGLSVSWKIVARHAGKIEVESEIGKGTTFTVTLPVEPGAIVRP